MTQEPTRQPRKRRGKTALIDPEQVRAMIAEGRSVADVAEHFDCSNVAILGICHDYDIALKSGRRTLIHDGGKRVERRPPQAQAPSAKPAPEIAPREASLIATGGRYADLRAWAQRWGVTEVKARQEWHALRLPVRKGGCA